MGGVPLSVKYMITARIEVGGLVDKSDIIGAIFGQLEGLLGDELDLRELQRTGRIGRIEITVERSGGRTVGTIKVPSNLDRVETALIAAAMEVVDRVGPYPAKVEVVKLKDVRAEKRKRIIERAKELLKKWEEEEVETKELIEEVIRSLKAAELIKYGPEGLPAGPDVAKSDTIIVVEGRADVLNLLRHGYRNVIALEGATIPKTLIELSKRKTVILFVDGDRGGELIARNAIGVLDVDYIARAPPGREVEELTGKEIAKSLRNKVPVEEFLEMLEREKRAVKVQRREVREPVEREVQAAKLNIPDEVVKAISELKGTLEALIYDDNWKEVKRLPVKDLAQELPNIKGARYLVFDGIITQRIVDIAHSVGLRAVIGARMGDVVRVPEGVLLLTFKDVAA